MTDKERIQARIERDKARRKAKREKRNAEYDDFGKVVTMQHYVKSLAKCNKGVRFKGSVQRYNMLCIENMYGTLTTIERGELPKLKNTRRILLYERGKARDIVPIVISDRMTQKVTSDHSLMPVLTPTLIYDNGASIKGKGVSFTRDELDKHLQEAVNEWGCDFYVFVYDFESYFASIPHATCDAALKRQYSDERLIKLFMDIIKSYYPPDVVKGICLGSQVSQDFAVDVPNDVDHYAKDKLGFRHYLRHMDDGIAFAKTKEELQNLYDKLKEVAKSLGLKFNERKTAIVKATHGFTWLKTKYVVTKKGTVLKRLTRKTIVRMRRKLKRFRGLVDKGKMSLDNVYDSFQSWLSHTDGRRCYKSVKNMLRLYNELFNGYKITAKWRHFENGILRDRTGRQYRWDCVE